MTADAVVIGIGAAGGAALHHLARRGVRAVGIERFAPGHDRGSSHGRTRVIRMAYYEHPDYVPLLRAAYARWAELEEEAGERIYREIGVLEIGPEAGEVLSGVRASATAHGIPTEPLSAADVRRRFPGFSLPDDWAAVFEPGAGTLLADAAQAAHVRLATARGASVRTGETVLGWRRDGDGYEVRTDRGRVRAARLVVCPGAWASDLLPRLGVRFSVRRKTIFFHEAPSPAHALDGGCPAYLFDTPSGIFYGIPRGDEADLKVAEHTGGADVADPLHVERHIDFAERDAVERFVAAHLPGAAPRARAHVVCLYPMSPDEHFVIGRDPEDAGVCFAAGLSGHGFKFASVIGEILTDLALTGATAHPIAFLSPARAAAAAGP